MNNLAQSFVEKNKPCPSLIRNLQMSQTVNLFEMHQLPEMPEFFMGMYVSWCMIVSVIDAIVCGNIFYTAYNDGSNGLYYGSYVQQLYSLPGMDYSLSHWLQVYGATSVTKLVVYPAIMINPFLILIINSYLYGTSFEINSTLGQYCNSTTATNQTITCQVFTNPVQYQQLTELNKIQLFGSIVVILLIPFILLMIFSVNVLIRVPKYLYDVTIRIHERACCKCYRNTCQNIFYIFCYGPKPDPGSNTPNPTQPLVNSRSPPSRQNRYDVTMV